MKSQAQHDTTKWHLYFKGAKFKKDALNLLQWTVKEADLTSVSSSTVKCQYVKSLGSNKEAWRAYRLTLFEGSSLHEKLCSRLRTSLDSMDFDKSVFTTVKG